MVTDTPLRRNTTNHETHGRSPSRVCRWIVLAAIPVIRRYPTESVDVDQPTPILTFCSDYRRHIGMTLRKTKILSTGALLGGIAGSAIGYFSPTAVHFPAVIAIYAVLFCILGVGVSAVAWMVTRTSEEREEGKRREEHFQKQTADAS